GAGYVGFAGPAVAFEEEHAPARAAETPARAGRRAVPPQCFVTRHDPDAGAVSAEPGDDPGSVRAPAHRAATMRAPFRRRGDVKTNGAAETGAVDQRLIHEPYDARNR